ncbi:MAG: hypothetical protein Q9170_007496 [Blastenia crenularia]
MSTVWPRPSCSAKSAFQGLGWGWNDFIRQGFYRACLEAGKGAWMDVFASKSPANFALNYGRMRKPTFMDEATLGLQERLRRLEDPAINNPRFIAHVVYAARRLVLNSNAGRRFKDMTKQKPFQSPTDPPLPPALSPRVSTARIPLVDLTSHSDAHAGVDGWHDAAGIVRNDGPQGLAAPPMPLSPMPLLGTSAVNVDYGYVTPTFLPNALLQGQAPVAVADSVERVMAWDDGSAWGLPMPQSIPLGTADSFLPMPTHYMIQGEDTNKIEPFDPFWSLPPREENFELHPFPASTNGNRDGGWDLGFGQGGLGEFFSDLVNGYSGQGSDFPAYVDNE